MSAPRDLTPDPFPKGKGSGSPPSLGEGRGERSDLEQERQRYVEALEHVLSALPSAFARLPEVERVWLCGSYARGRRDLLTDLDLIVVMRSEQDVVTRTAQLYGRLATLLPLEVDIDLVTYTPEEFAQARAGGFLKSALAGGQIVYERAG